MPLTWKTSLASFQLCCIDDLVETMLNSMYQKPLRKNIASATYSPSCGTPLSPMIMAGSSIVAGIEASIWKRVM